MRRLLQITAFLALLGSAQAQGNFEAITGFSNNIAGGFAGTAGWTFVPIEEVTVTEIGFFDTFITDNGDIDLGIWLDNGDIAVTNTVRLTSPLIGNTRYESITPVKLNPGVIYHIGAATVSGQPINLGVVDDQNGGSFTMSQWLSFRGAAQNTSGFGFPPELAGWQGVMLLGPNFRYNHTGVPEPSSVVLFSLGGLALMLRRRRR